MSAPDKHVYSPEDAIEVSGVGTGLTVGDLLASGGFTGGTTAENDKWFNELVDMAQEATGEDLSAARIPDAPCATDSVPPQEA